LRRALALPFACLLAAAFAAGPVQGQPVPEDKTRDQRYKSEYELEQERLNWQEGEIKLPAYPKTEGLIEFFVSGASSFRFFIDPASLSPGRDGVVRYTLIARSSSGYANVSYEGIRCATSTYRIYALGHDGRWIPKDSEWREIGNTAGQRWHNVLRSRFFCPVRIPIWTAAEGLDALRRGGHPAATEKTNMGN
jgi:hypothetical protein